MPALNQDFSNLGQRTAGLFNRPTPFKQSFQQLGLGGKGQQSFLKGKGERLKQVGDIAQKEVKAKTTQAKTQLNQQQALVSKGIQDTEQELQQARRWALEDVDNFVKEKMRERQIYLEALQRRRDVMRKKLQGAIDEESLGREMEGINTLIQGVSSSIATMAPRIKGLRLTPQQQALQQTLEGVQIPRRSGLRKEKYTTPFTSMLGRLPYQEFINKDTSAEDLQQYLQRQQYGSQFGHQTIRDILSKQYRGF